MIVHVHLELWPKTSSIEISSSLPEYRVILVRISTVNVQYLNYTILYTLCYTRQGLFRSLQRPKHLSTSWGNGPSDDVLEELAEMSPS